MPNITWKKSQNESLEIAYKAALALAPLALESVCPKPVATLIEHFAGSTLNLFFEQEPTTCRGKTLKIIGDALAELFETERYEDMQSFFAKTDFRMDAFSALENSNALAAKLGTRFAQYKGESPEEMYKYYPHISSFLTDLHHSVKARIDADEDLEKYWRDIKTANTVQEMNERDKAEQRKHEEEQPAHNRNDKYRNKWNERCCLHKSEAQPLVTLETIYVMPEVQVGEERLKVGDCVKDFLENDTQHILLLLGHGGYGKTSFVARMAAKTGEYTDRPLHIFRLREFADTDANELYKRIAEMAKLENNAVLVFDGLDELCMVGGGKETEKSLDLLTQLMFFFDQSSSYKIIITSRPEYISAEKALERLEKLKISAKRFVSYCYAAFSERQRGELVDSIEKADPALTGSLGCEQVRKFKDNENNKDDAIYGSPFLLYLICAAHEKLTPECFENRWLLFRTVFHDINPQPDYKKMQENTTGRGAVAMEHLDKLYRITSRLAYEIYKTGYEKQYFQKEEVRRIIAEMYHDTPDLIDNLELCYALCAYFKQTENGAIEFAHNHVRDFFLCEYILQGLDDCYAERGKGKSAEECGKMVADWLSDRFKYADTKGETDRFLALAAKQKKTACPNVEQYFKLDELKHVFNVFCHNGGLREYCAEEMPIGAQSAARNVILCSARFLQTLLPETNGLIRWFGVGRLNFGERVIIEQMRRFLDHADLSGAILMGANLRGADLRNADMIDAGLIDADMRWANLRGADLSGATLTDADLWRAKLSGANLISADLSGANLTNADLKIANLKSAKLTNTYLISANLKGANLRGADLRSADLSSADLRDANLTGAIYNSRTIFTDVTPSDFDPEKAGMIKVDI